MRTTLTLDDDVAARLAQLRARADRPFKELVNDLLRTGLAHVDREQPAARGPYTRPVSLGRPLLPDVDDISEVLAVAERDDYR